MLFFQKSMLLWVLNNHRLDSAILFFISNTIFTAEKSKNLIITLEDIVSGGKKRNSSRIKPKKKTIKHRRKSVRR
jgi:hypothetical protein